MYISAKTCIINQSISNFDAFYLCIRNLTVLRIKCAIISVLESKKDDKLIKISIETIFKKIKLVEKEADFYLIKYFF